MSTAAEQALRTADSQARVLAMIRSLMERHAHMLRGYRVLLFGSRARGDARERSDFDIGVIGDHPMSPDAYDCIESELEALPTLYRIDWVDLARVADAFRERALREGVTIHES